MMKRRTLGTLSLGLAMGLVTGTPVAAQTAQVTAPRSGHFHEGDIGEKLLAIERNLRCNCSCGLDVHMCQFRMTCDTSPVWSARVLRDLEAGLDAKTIEASFVADFGGTVLMAPPAEGFNLVGYLLPGFAILMAGMLVGLIARGGAARPHLAPVEQPTDEQANRLEAALKRLDETEGPDW